MFSMFLPLPLLLFPFLSSPCLPSPSPSLSCSSLPVSEQYDTTLYFACTCHQDSLTGHFSLATFAYNLSQDIFDRGMVVDFRDCWSLDIIMDQLELSNIDSDYFRPDFQFEEISVENVLQVRNGYCLFNESFHTSQVHFVQSQATSENVEYIPYPAHPLSVHLYDVTTVTVDSGAQLDHLTTDWAQTKLYIDLTKQYGDQQDYAFDIDGFEDSNILFVTDEIQDDVQQVCDE